MSTQGQSGGLSRKEAYVSQRELPEQAAYLCTFVLEDTTDDKGVARYPVGHWPLLDLESKEVIIDSHGRRSYTSVAFGPSLGQNIAWATCPRIAPKRATRC